MSQKDLFKTKPFTSTMVLDRRVELFKDNQRLGWRAELEPAKPIGAYVTVDTTNPEVAIRATILILRQAEESISKVEK